VRDGETYRRLGGHGRGDGLLGRLRQAAARLLHLFEAPFLQSRRQLDAEISLHNVGDVIQARHISASVQRRTAGHVLGHSRAREIGPSGHVSDLVTRQMRPWAETYTTGVEVTVVVAV
jgi:hypothetical protein